MNASQFFCNKKNCPAAAAPAPQFFPPQDPERQFDLLAPLVCCKGWRAAVRGSAATHTLYRAFLFWSLDEVQKLGCRQEHPVLVVLRAALACRTLGMLAYMQSHMLQQLHAARGPDTQPVLDQARCIQVCVGQHTAAA